MFLKLNGSTIEGHHHNTSLGHTVEIQKQRITDNNGYYLYKYVSDKLVNLSQEEVNSHPLKISREARKASIKIEDDMTENDCSTLKNDVSVKPYIKRLIGKHCR